MIFRLEVHHMGDWALDPHNRQRFHCSMGLCTVAGWFCVKDMDRQHRKHVVISPPSNTWQSSCVSPGTHVPGMSNMPNLGTHEHWGIEIKGNDCWIVMLPNNLSNCT
ncbi:hypothetical protein M404DRAFT_826596 [Pisolithus tinctorius Marx 270]|uniref:Uncharacterized protein n=1 Tax=Pisolithus tinctorius Marx 270 TaxID=870435 RepID=A0A0C3NTY7_PISTI|nr:hypothetical protein M404DRAFT_826596 [Pisolithus tinctorius Marx 270]